MFDREIRGQLAMLMGGRAAEELTCEAGGWVGGAGGCSSSSSRHGGLLRIRRVRSQQLACGRACLALPCTI